MEKNDVKIYVDKIYESEEKVTFPILLNWMKEKGIETEGNEDYISKELKNCIYWKNLSKKAVEILDTIAKYYNVTLQPYGFDNEGVRSYKEAYPQEQIFNHFLMEKMQAKRQRQFMSKPFLMPVYWVPTAKAKIIKKPGRAGK